MPTAACQLLKDFGLAAFVAIVGINSGLQAVTTLKQTGYDHLPAGRRGDAAAAVSSPCCSDATCSSTTTRGAAGRRAVEARAAQTRLRRHPGQGRKPGADGALRHHLRPASQRAADLARSPGGRPGLARLALTLAATSPRKRAFVFPDQSGRTGSPPNAYTLEHVMTKPDLSKLANLSPFRLKDELIKLASSDADRMMLNAGRGNPNFLATVRAMPSGSSACSPCANPSARSHMPEGVGGFPRRAGIRKSVSTCFARELDPETSGVEVPRRRATCPYVRDQLGLDAGDFLHTRCAKASSPAITRCRTACSKAKSRRSWRNTSARR
ncbi:hypothetical protein ACU4GD_45520 [Cupriavidus basilensis]